MILHERLQLVLQLSRPLAQKPSHSCRMRGQPSGTRCEFVACVTCRLQNAEPAEQVGTIRFNFTTHLPYLAAIYPKLATEQKLRLTRGKPQQCKHPIFAA
jgi:hypothetical protein